MSFLSLVIGLLTIILVVDSLLLILLILAQLPKKDAGAGLAFGGVASDALFGAGSGTMLTRLTKYATGGFLALALTLSILQSHQAKSMGRGISSELEKKAGAIALPPASTTPTATTQAVSALQPVASTNIIVPALTTQLSNAPALTTPAILAPSPATNAEAPAK